MTLCPSCEGTSSCNGIGYLGSQASYTEADLTHHIDEKDPAYQTWRSNLTSLYHRLCATYPECPNPEFQSKIAALAQLLGINHPQT